MSEYDKKYLLWFAVCVAGGIAMDFFEVAELTQQNVVIGAMIVFSFSMLYDKLLKIEKRLEDME